ncbi:hypothetical protein HZA96_03195 [Candidatus Woesearchaeota archaeon]|nr:hypothetical protein [Candidatus Woesearchaeota archaeon]
MDQNRNKLINLLIGNLSNAIVHRILVKAIDDELIISRYGKEIRNSIDLANRYREKINPNNRQLPDKDIDYILKSLQLKVKAKLEKRISDGYEGINFSLVEPFVVDALKELKVLIKPELI